MALTGIPPAAFMRSGNPDDPRSQRTRTLLLDELERQLARDGRLPSVAALVDAAGVSRGAFYKHFDSIQELSVAAVRTALEGLGDERPGGEADSATVDYGELFNYIDLHRPLFAAVIANSNDEPARDELREVLIGQAMESLARKPNRPPELSTRRAATFLVGGILGAVSEWLMSDHPCDPYVLATQVALMMPDWVLDEGGPPPVHVHNAR